MVAKNPARSHKINELQSVAGPEISVKVLEQSNSSNFVPWLQYNNVA